MKKFLSVMVAFVLILGLSSCAKPYNNANNLGVITCFSSNITANISEELYACTYTRNSQNSSTLKIDSPKEISGLTFTKNPQGYNACLEGISLSENQENLPTFSIIKILDTVLDSIENNNVTETSNQDNKIIIKGENQNYNFEATVLPENNFIEKINIANPKAEFVFFNQTSLT